MSPNAKSKRKGVTPAVHSVLDVLVGHIVDAFQAGLLRVCQHNVLDGIAHMTQPIGDPSGGHRGEEPWAQASCKIQFCPSPSDCKGALEAHQAPFEGPHCPR